ncbi:MAG: SH3 domain-containing protein [Sphingobacteriaceae bacterium]|nr:SH3 domain-containing protein [Sphingobacteriaceae bacterium]
MSSPFNYEIDEKNLRSRLKDRTVPYREDAFIQFESYSEYNKSSHKPRSLPNFNLSIGRNIIIPVIFGVAILLLSIILYKFIEIKNASNTVTEQLDKPIENIQPQQNPEIIPVVKDSILPEKTRTDSTAVDSLKLITEASPTLAAIVNSTTPTPSIVINTSSLTTEQKAISAWFVPNNCEVYESPNIASKVIGNLPGGKNYNVYEITNYFLKVKFSTTGETGYILKRLAGTTENSTAKKKKSAEEMESKPLDELIPKTEEPELK